MARNSGGAFKDLLPTELIVPILKKTADRSGLQSNEVDEVILGHCIQRTDEPNTARTAALLAGLDDSTTGFTVHQRALHAIENGYFDSQIVPITVKTRKREITVRKDENPRADLTVEKLSSLKPVFRKGGSVTAGNASSLNDGGAALVLMPEEHALEK